MDEKVKLNKCACGATIPEGYRDGKYCVDCWHKNKAFIDKIKSVSINPKFKR